MTSMNNNAGESNILFDTFYEVSAIQKFYYDPSGVIDCIKNTTNETMVTAAVLFLSTMSEEKIAILHDLCGDLNPTLITNSEEL